MALRVLLAMNHAIMLQALRELLNQEGDIEVIGGVGDGRTTIDMVRKSPPDVVVMEAILPELNGVETTRQIRAEAPGVVVVGLSMHHDHLVGRMMGAGASAYFGKADTAGNLAEGIRQAWAGHQYVSPQLMGSYTRYLQNPDNGGTATLTGKELEVFQLVTEGRTTREIAMKFVVSEKTVRSQLWRVKKKLGLSSVAALTKFAVREGITSPDP